MRAAVEGWFTTGPEPALLGSRCVSCATMFFPPVRAEGAFCGNPACAGEVFETVELSRRGTVWSYTDARYQPPAPYVPRSDPYQPFALAAVELAEGITVLGQVADGYGVAELRVGGEVELVVEPLDDELLIWRWKPVTELGEEADQ
ncbi:MAG TPA: OB-fold domain-containing protein [Nocardioides sp.]|uniref:Zn-ribbon domain-containing OB-fold protein n=1 Tax=uncultured Nocardioides sp. TaxID=198441 RepID=UPI002610B002|nr:OB-fold domain-containing protein [uncultured Nocardioides sp.]HRD59939.1 OB-fold domain-containing protein [Nocardioides sp.]HRI95123.1 OB-fold domain-containing protein [Nocardioides sp.]HRK44951.1 OB-fold domain-containing protein [Nocardioides sp.]